MKPPPQASQGSLTHCCELGAGLSIVQSTVARLTLESGFYVTVHRKPDFIMHESVTCRCEKQI